MPTGKLNEFIPYKVPVGFVQVVAKILYTTLRPYALSNQMVAFMGNDVKQLTARL
jgi:hypothetical protein